MEKVWLKHYPVGVPAEVDVNIFRSVPHLFAESVKKFQNRKAYLCMGASLTFGKLDRISRHIAAWLQSKGLSKGDRVAVMLPNVLQYPVCVFAILRAGFTVVNVNPLYTPRELEHQLNDSGAEVIFVLENFAHTVQDVIGKTSLKFVVVTSMGDLMGFFKGALVNFVVRSIKKKVPAWSIPEAIKFNNALVEGIDTTLKTVEVNQNDIAFLQYTGGTTGISKGAMLTHGNIIANLEQVSAWFSPKHDDSHPYLMVTPLPLYHIYSLTCCCLFMMREGGCNLLIPNPRDIPGFIKELRKYRFTAITALNTLYNGLMNHPDFTKINFSNLNLSLAGGMAMQRSVAEKWHQLTGQPVIEGYGLTETSPVATSNPLTSNRFNGTIGVPIPSTVVTIRDDEENILQFGETGELCIQGPQVMKGYWNRPDETQKVMTKDGAFKTGDIGFMNEEGFIKIVDRKKDMILVSGFNVYPNEIEEIVAGHPGVLECAAIGIPHPESGEVPKIFVVKKDPALTEEALIKYCRENMTGYKIPKAVEFRTELPKTNVGKILRRALRD